MCFSLDFHLRADSSQVTDTLLPRLGGDEGVELVGTFHNGDPASVRETAEVATELKQAVFHLIKVVVSSEYGLTTLLLSKPKDKSCNQFSSHLTLSLSHKLGLGGICPLLADQTISSGVPVRSVSLQQLVDPGRVAQTRHSADPEEDGDREEQDVLQ